MEQQSFLYSQPYDPNNPPEKQILQRCKDMLENIWSTLAFGADLRKIKQRNINMFETDLRNILMEMQKISGSQFSLMGSIQSLHGNVTNAIDKLYMASYYERKSTPEEMQLFLQEIRPCQQHVYNALLECKRLLGEE